MALPTQPFHDEHAALLDHIEHIRQVAGNLDDVSLDERRAMLERILAFLRGTLLPHARAEEEVLYPEWSRLIGSPHAAAPMIHDHRAIVARTEALAAADPADLQQLRELLYGLYALISVHFGKEEDIQLPAFDANPEVAARVLERVGEHAHNQH